MKEGTLRMDGTKEILSAGMCVEGRYGKYRLKKKIGHGGNGSVYSVEVIEQGEGLPKEDNFAIKFLIVEPRDEKEMAKRKARFKKEFEQLLSIQKKVDGIIPVYDASFLQEEGSGALLWYLMPMAAPFEYKQDSTSVNLERMLELGRTIKQLHDLGYAHRDIKPKNLLIYQNRLCLSDFGLIWNQNDEDEHITEVNDRLGPMAIRPPELQPVENIDGVDYRFSDVYLFAKTVWMVIKANGQGFPREYSRILPEICIRKEEIHAATAEPLHVMMENATKNNYWERIHVSECLEYLQNQIDVLSENVPETELNRWKYAEQAAWISESVTSDEQIYKDSRAVLCILNKMAGACSLIFTEQEETCAVLQLRKALVLKDEIYNLEISNPYNGGRRKKIGMAISEIRKSGSTSFEIYLRQNSNIDDMQPCFKQIIKALQSTKQQVYLKGKYVIKITDTMPR